VREFLSPLLCSWPWGYQRAKAAHG
jgi:hypothetical protein